MENKKITLLACDIESDNINLSNSSLYTKLLEKLKTGAPADTRRMKLNASLPDEDMLSNYGHTDEYVYGTMFRIAPSKESPSIPDDLFKNDKINLNDIASKDNKTLLICKEYYYFAINKSVLITSMPKSRIKSFQTYINWLLGETEFRFNPKIKSDLKIKLNEIKRIEFQDVNEDLKSGKEKNMSIIELAKDKLCNLAVDIPSLDNLINEKIISAKLLLKIADKNKKISQEDLNRKLGSLIRPINEDENIVLTLKGGRRIRGNNIIDTKEVYIEIINENNMISEQQLWQEMLIFMREFNK